MDLALNNLQWLICHKTEPNQTIHLSSVNEIKFLVGIYEQRSCIVFFCMYSIVDSTDNQNLQNCGSISPKSDLIFPEKFLDVSFDTIMKQGIYMIYLSN